MNQPGNVTDTKGVAAVFALRGGDHERGRNPGEPGNTDFGERGGEQKPGARREEITATAKWLPERIFQPGEIAATVVKCKQTG